MFRDRRQSFRSPLLMLWENIALISVSGQTLLPLLFSPGCFEPPPRDTLWGVTAEPEGTRGRHQTCPCPKAGPSPFLILDTSRLICGVGTQGLSHPGCPCPLRAMNYSHHSVQALRSQEQHPTQPSLPQLLGAAKPEAPLTSHQREQCYSAPRQLPPSN